MFDITGAKAFTTILPFWSLAVEIHFYLLFALAYKLCNRAISYKTICLIIFLMFLFYATAVAFKNSFYASVLHRNLRDMTFIMIGTIFFINDRSNDKKSLLSMVCLLGLYILILCFLTDSGLHFLLLNQIPNQTVTHWENWDSGQVSVMFHFISRVLAFVVFLASLKLLGGQNKALNFLANISYPLYLLHLPIISAVHKWHINIIATTILAIVFSFVFSFLVHKYIENPCIKYSKRTR